ncbi:MAG: pyrroline-5-carboxylate reductase [Verrucomicrobiota bacterium]
MRIAIIGTGKMGTAIARGLIAERTVTPADLRGADVSAEAREAFAGATGAEVCASPAEAVDGCDIVLLAVKPQVAEEAARQIAADCAGKLVLSIAAGIRLSSLEQWFGTTRIVRVMPNTPMTIARGVAAYACAEGVTEDDRRAVKTIFSAVGIAREVPEDQMDTVTALSGSGPAYVFEFIQAMIEAAAALGMDSEDALDLAVQTVAGAAEMVAAGCGGPVELRDAVTSKGGTTAEGLRVLREHDFRDLMKSVLKAAHDRSVELGKG